MENDDDRSKQNHYAFINGRPSHHHPSPHTRSQAGFFLVLCSWSSRSLLVSSLPPLRPQHPRQVFLFLDHFRKRSQGPQPSHLFQGAPLILKEIRFMMIFVAPFASIPARRPFFESWWWSVEGWSSPCGVVCVPSVREKSKEVVCSCEWWWKVQGGSFSKSPFSIIMWRSQWMADKSIGTLSINPSEITSSKSYKLTSKII